MTLTITDLPDEVLGQIFKNVFQIYSPKFVSPPTAGEVERMNKWRLGERTRLVTTMRLVCRKWAHWLYKGHLYDTLSFQSSKKSSAFTNQLALAYYSNRLREIPQCRYLKIPQLWTGWQPPPPGKTRYPDFVCLLDRFYKTIVALDIQAVNLFTLHMLTIGRIGQLEKLRFLRLRIDFTTRGKITFRGRSLAADSIPNHYPTDSECLLALLREAKQVVCLDLTDFRPVCSPGSIAENLGDCQFPGIKALKLDVKAGENLTHVGIERIATRLPNLTVLWIGGNGHEESQILVPLFKILREQLEEVFFNDARVMRYILDLRFPKLRVLRLHEWGNNLNDYSRKPMLAEAPLEVLALHCYPFRKRPNISLSAPFQALPHLRRLEFHEASKFPPPSRFKKSCERHGLECVFRDHDDIGEDGRLILDFDSPSVLRNQFMI
ncbi:hypothetical protein PTTG_11860 [Puccinia triticina 1-1 BBBD Race 1]|uniref:F-box domain-containing protein n=2 Tax=Puccinia triticina TaxID=208348 RepID=A0A180GN44_PUCT1|nr:uncharacterized protein PtA15_16A270 [Puccinia triticina]OAV93839.1 hypothetical protein PTTG_11860 [Puccinia triticina 1-1 BBBD Race 1]WAQ92363.1 hypothetical protein PtA15_16A270 [Puccinia triticina]WAR64098.1 hypothetical protein PtB15_16B258 [Puccinia triticina]